MPVSSFGFQTVVSALGAIALIVTMASSKSKTQRIVGAIEKSSDHSVTITTHSLERVTVYVPETTPIFLNADRLTFSTLEDGRKATVHFTKENGRLIATELDVFPTLADDPLPPSEPPIA